MPFRGPSKNNHKLVRTDAERERDRDRESERGRETEGQTDIDRKSQKSLCCVYALMMMMDYVTHII